MLSLRSLVDSTSVSIFSQANIKILIAALQASDIVYKCDQTSNSMCIRVGSASDRNQLIGVIKFRLSENLNGYIFVDGAGKLSNRFIIKNLNKNLFITRVAGMSDQAAYARPIKDELNNSFDNTA